MKKTALLATFVVLGALTGCDDEPKTEVAAASPELAEKTAAQEKTEKSAEEVAAEKLAEEESEKLADEVAEQAEVEANPLTACCRSLGQKAFTLRSPEFHGASKACGEAMGAKKDLSDVLPAIKKALKDKPLPSECTGQ